jgi:hypothetical protein
MVVNDGSSIPPHSGEGDRDAQRRGGGVFATTRPVIRQARKERRSGNLPKLLWTTSTEMVKLCTLPLLIFIVGCVQIQKSVKLAYQYVDRPEERRILVEFTNTRSRDICIYDQYWPLETGNRDIDGRIFMISIVDSVYLIENYNQGYPPSQQVIKVPVGKTIRSFLRYEHFSIPPREYNTEKIVQIKPEWKFC